MNRKIVADLHNHSNASDGEYTPAELVKRAGNIGLEAVALTDHDTLKGLKEALLQGSKSGIQVIPGVEVSFRFRRPYFVGTLHLLLYFTAEQLFDKNYVEELESLLSQGRGPGLVKERVRSINTEFGPQGKQPFLKRNLEFDEVAAYASNISRRHFARALSEKHGISDKEKVNSLIGNDSPAYIPSGIEMELFHPFVRKYNPLMVLAHPAAGSFPGPSHYREVLPPVEVIEKIYPEFLDLGIRGIEVYYPAHLPDHQKMLLEWAKRDNLIVSGGSDCHDEVDRPLGVSGITRDEFETFKTRLMESCGNGA